MEPVNERNVYEIEGGTRGGNTWEEEGEGEGMEREMWERERKGGKGRAGQDRLVNIENSSCCPRNHVACSDGKNVHLVHSVNSGHETY